MGKLGAFEERQLFERVNQAGLTFYRNSAWTDLRHGIFTRHGGVSKSHWSCLNLGASIGDDLAAVKENHRRMYAAAEVNPAGAVSCWLVHGVKTLVVNGNWMSKGKLEQADGLITDEVDRPLVMRYADCVPLLLYDATRRAIGLGHAGWRGTVLGMAGAMVRQMGSAFGCRPQDIQVVIGPAISRRNYRVGEEVAAQADAAFGADAGVVHRDPAGGWPMLDLWRANRMDLVRNGVEHVETLEICTFENADDFYSHRAENGLTGRFGVVISL